MSRILVVDDEKSIQLLFADELTDEGYEVVTTGDGGGVMGLIEKARPDLVVLDIKLGKKDGLDLLQDIRNTYYNMPVVVCTAYPNYKGDLKSIAADYYVVKSSDLRELKEKVRMAFEGSEYVTPLRMLNDFEHKVVPLQNRF